MSQQTGDRIVTEAKDIPHIKDRRLDVLAIHAHVEKRGLDPRTVADRWDVDLADVYAALLYYHEHPEEMERLQREREEAFEEIKRTAREHRPESVDPSEH